MVDSQVTQVELENDDSAVLTIRVVGYAEGTSVDITGYITQDSGAHAGFRATQILPKPDPDGAAEVKVTVPAKDLHLMLKDDIRVITWVTGAWPSKLTQDPSATGPFKARWTGGEYDV